MKRPDPSKVHEPLEIQLNELSRGDRVAEGSRPNTIKEMGNPAMDLRNAGRLEEALKLQLELLERSRRDLGVDHLDTIGATENLVLLSRDVGHFNFALEKQQEVLGQKLRILGPEHPETLGANSILALILRDLGRLNEAAERQQEVLGQKLRILGPEHPETLGANSILALILRDLGRANEAAERQQMLLESRKRVLRSQDVYTLAAMNDLALTLDGLGKFREAEELLEEVVQQAGKANKEEEPEASDGTAFTLAIEVASHNLARLSAEQARVESLLEDATSGIEQESDAERQSSNESHSIAAKASEPKPVPSNVVVVPKFTPDEIVVVVLGPTGVGKSHFVREATGDSSIRLGHGLMSETDQLSAHRTYIDGQPVVVIDTVGFDDSYRSDTEVLLEIATWLADAYADKVRLAGVLYMHDIRSVRFSGSASKNLQMFRKLVGEVSFKDVVLVTNGWYGIDPDLGESRLREMKRRPDIWGGMIEEGSRIARYGGDAKDAQQILRSVLNQKRSTVLNIQREIVDEKLPLSETAAGKALLKEFERFKEEYKREMARLRLDTQEALRSKDNEMYDLLIQERMRAEKLLQKSEAQASALKSYKAIIEEGNRSHQKEMKRLQEAFEDRVSSLEMGTADPPPAYTEPQAAVTALHESGCPTEDPALTRTILKILEEFFQKLIRPRRRAGYTRLEWRCTCGELLYGDFKETTGGSLDGLTARLREHSGQRSQSQASTSVPIPTKERMRHYKAFVGWELPGNSGSSNQSNPMPALATAARPITNTQSRQALQLCIETGKYTIELGELDLQQSDSDGVLFERIREKYERVRRSMLPLRFRFSKPANAIFVKFRLAKPPFVAPIAGSKEAPVIPPKEEVTAGRYEYTPCPIDEPPMDNRTFFHHFYARASDHPDTMWSTRLPWKIGPSLGPMAQGWGIHLEERPDWPLFSLLMFLFLLLSGLVAGMYCWKTGDNQTGVAIGAWLTAVQAMGIAAMFFY